MKYKQVISAHDSLIKNIKEISISLGCKFESLITMMTIKKNDLYTQKQLVKHISEKFEKTKAKDISIIKVKVTNAINCLVDSKLITTEQSKEDKRVHVIKLTKIGNKISEEIERGDYV